MPQGFSAKVFSLSLSHTHTHKPSNQKGVGFCRIDVHIKLQTEGIKNRKSFTISMWPLSPFGHPLICHIKFKGTLMKDFLLGHYCLFTKTKKRLLISSDAMSVCAWFMGGVSYVHVISKKKLQLCVRCVVVAGNVGELMTVVSPGNTFYLFVPKGITPPSAPLTHLDVCTGGLGSCPNPIAVCVWQLLKSSALENKKHKRSRYAVGGRFSTPTYLLQTSVVWLKCECCPVLGLKRDLDTAMPFPSTHGIVALYLPLLNSCVSGIDSLR